MPSIINVLGWKAEGLRCPDHEIFCADPKGKPFRVTLVQMPNGTGKTTTLALLRAALSGEAAKDEWTRDQVLEFAKRGDDAPDFGRFEVRLALNERKATFVMEFDFQNGRVAYKTTHGTGQKSGFVVPTEFRRFLHPNFIHFFIFDGELAQRLLDRSKTNAEAAVEALFQINVFTKLVDKVKGYWEDRTTDSKATEERGRARRKNRVRDLADRIRTLEGERARLRNDRDRIVQQLEAKQDLYVQEIQKDETVSREIEETRLRHERLKSDVRSEANALLDAMRDPYALSPVFARRIADLRTGLDKVKLPESAALEFFEELAEEANCVCGRPIDEHIRDVIRSGAQQYLGSEDVSLLNSMKTAIHEAVGDDPGEAERILRARIAEMEKVVDEEREVSNSLDALRYDAEQSDPAVKEAKKQIDVLKDELEELDERLEKFESKDDEQGDGQTFGIDILVRRHRDAEVKLAQITETIELKDKRDILVTILSEAHAEARRTIAADICRETNERINLLMPFNKLVVERIDRSLVLKGQAGGSMGETLSIAYAFLATLFDRATHKLPFIVDSPAGAIDLDVRPKIGELAPRLSDQFIAFTISSERERFISSLEKASKSKPQFLTLFRKGGKKLDKAALAQGKVSETDDGILVHGREFFNDFQLEQEAT